MRKKGPLLASLVASLASCSPEASEPDAVFRAQSTVSADVVSSGTAGRGYRHLPERSRFPVGASARSESVGPVTRITGADGAYATFSNGATVASPHGGSQLLMLPFGTFSAADHNDRVLKYFVAAGLPPEQVSGVHATTMMRTSGASGATGVASMKEPEFVAYFSIVERSVAGVRVQDSFAWARLAESGVSVWESVYWPDIPESTVTEADAFRATMSDDALRAKFLQKLPESARLNGGVSIRHTPFSSFRPFSTVVVYEAMVKPENGKPSLRHFRPDGVEVRLAEETPVMKDTPRDPATPL